MACATATRSRSGTASSKVVATLRTFVDRRAMAAAALRTSSSVSSSRFPSPTRIAAFAPRSPPVGTASVWPALASNPASSMNAASPPPSAWSTRSVPGPGSRGANTGTASRSAATLSAALFESLKVTGTRSLRCGVVVVAFVSGIGVVGPGGPELALLPARQGPAEVGEPVQVRHDLAVGSEPSIGRGGDGLALGAPHHRAGQIERGGDAVLTREHELGRWFEPGRGLVDHRLERGDHLPGHEGRA